VVAAWTLVPPLLSRRARVVHVEMTMEWSVLRSSPPARQRLRAAVGILAGHFHLGIERQGRRRDPRGEVVPVIQKAHG
jgi:hypothetical protein